VSTRASSRCKCASERGLRRDVDRVERAVFGGVDVDPHAVLARLEIPCWWRGRLRRAPSRPAFVRRAGRVGAGRVGAVIAARCKYCDALADHRRQPTARNDVQHGRKPRECVYSCSAMARLWPALARIRDADA
jgi:hypothetical protein